MACQSDDTLEKVKKFSDRIDYMTLNALFQSTICCKSSAIAMSLILGSNTTVEQAVRYSRIDEDFQTKHFGIVEGAHDLDEAYLYTVFSTAKAFVSLA